LKEFLPLQAPEVPEAVLWVAQEEQKAQRSHPTRPEQNRSRILGHPRVKCQVFQKKNHVPPSLMSGVSPKAAEAKSKSFKDEI
jgi:hypothetical protein